MSKKINTPQDYYETTSYVPIPCFRYEDSDSNSNFLKGELDKLFDLVSGRATPIEGFITTKSGNNSDRKILSLINKLVECSEAFEEERSGKCSPEKSREHKRAMEFYRCFFYCAINCFTCTSMYELKPTQTFGDIMDLAAGVHSYRELLERDFSDWDAPMDMDFDRETHDTENIFRRMCKIYHELTGKFIADEFTDEDRDIISDLIEQSEETERAWLDSLEEDDEREHVREDGTVMTDEELTEYRREMQEEYYSTMPEPAPEEEEYENSLLAGSEKFERDLAEWIAALPNQEKLLNCYRRMRELVKEGYKSADGGDIRRMIDCFLCVNGLNGFADDEATVEAVQRIRRAKRAVENDFRRRGIL